MELDDLYQDVILDHGRKPRNYGVLEDATNIEKGFNPLCGDKYTVYLKIEDNKINAASFTGEGCAISMAALSLLVEDIIGKPVVEAQKLFTAYIAQLTDKEIPDDVNLGKLQVMKGVKKFPMRIKCATMGCHALQHACGFGVSDE